MVDIEKILRYAHSSGASEAEVYRVTSRVISLRTASKVINASITHTDSMGIRVAVGRHVAIVGTQDVDEERVLKAVSSAVSIARSMPEDPEWRGLNELVRASPIPSLKDEFTAKAGAGELKEVFLDALEGVRSASSKAEIVRGLFTSALSRIEIVNSYGGPISQEGTSAFMYINVQLPTSDGRGTYSEFNYSNNLKGLKAKEVGEVAGSRVKDFIRGSKVRTGTYDVILDASVTASILSVMIAPSLSAKNVQEGRSPLQGRVGEQVLSNKLTIRDLGTDPRLVSSRSFDDEGFPTSDRTLIAKGVLEDYVYDTYTAKKEGRKSTGNAWRTFSTAPSPSPNHLYVMPGDATLDEMISSIRRGIYVVRTIGEWLSNPVSGSLNATVTHGYIIENGKLAGSCRGCVLAGNIYELMKDNLELVGKDVRNLSRSSSPSVKLARVKIAG